MDSVRQWSVRNCEPADEPGVSALFLSVFGRAVPEGYWRWKLRPFPVVAENEWIAVVGKKVVGHYAVTPVRFKVNGLEIVVPHGCDAMTHPDFRRQGILTALGQRANTVWERSGAPFQLGFHYGGWGSVRENLGWIPVARLTWLKRWLRPGASLAGRMGLPDSIMTHFVDRTFNRVMPWLRHEPPDAHRSGSLQVESIPRADSRFDLLWKKLSSEYEVLAVRDSQWLQWRFLDMPEAEHHVLMATRRDLPAGYLVFRVMRNGIISRASIVDWLVAPDDHVTAVALWNKAADEAAKLGSSSLAALVPELSPFAQTLRRSGFWRGRHGYDFSIIPYGSPVSVWEGREWFVTGSEGDVI